MVKRSKIDAETKTNTTRVAKREEVVSSLRKDILSGKIRGGQHLRQSGIASQFGISRMPVRDALMALRAEGLVTLNSGRGAVVASLWPEDIQELLEARSLLEGLIASYAAKSITKEDLGRLEKLVKRLDSALDNANAFYRINIEFHDIVRKAAKKERIVELTKNVRLSIEHYMRIASTFPELRQQLQPQHHEMLDAFRDRDYRAIERITRSHVMLGGKFLTAYFEQLNRT